MSKKKQPSGSSKVREISRWTKFFGFAEDAPQKDQTRRGKQETKAEKPK
jgi:hypothetical protein